MVDTTFLKGSGLATSHGVTVEGFVDQEAGDGMPRGSVLLSRRRSWVNEGRSQRRVGESWNGWEVAAAVSRTVKSGMNVERASG